MSSTVNVPLGKQPRWICGVCKEPITGVDGCVRITDRRSIEKPGYDPDAADESRALNDDGSIDFEATARHQVQAALDYLEDPLVRFQVAHYGCTKNDSAPSSYVVPCERAQRVEQWMAWVEHLAEKQWMKRRDLVRMMRFWFDAHGIAIPRDLG